MESGDTANKLGCFLQHLCILMMLKQLVVSVIASLKRTASETAQMAILRLVIKSVQSVLGWDD